jgi:hypothetical protein
MVAGVAVVVVVAAAAAAADGDDADAVEAVDAVDLAGSTYAGGHTHRGRGGEVEPYRPAWYDGQNREEQTRPLQTLGGMCHE